MLRIDELKIYDDLTFEQLKEKCLKKYKIDFNDVISFKIIKKSIDARNKDNVHYVYSFDIDVQNENKYSKIKKINYQKETIEINRTSSYQPIIIGAGPAGLFCALELVKNGFKPIIIEQGGSVLKRLDDVKKYRETGLLDPNSNVQFGEGGAGTFSDGKLTTNINSSLVKTVLEIFYEFGAPIEITYLSKPHIGTDNLINILQNMRKFIESKGGTYYFDTKFIDYETSSNLIKVKTTRKNFITDTLVLAIGHSSIDTFKLLQKKQIHLERKIFAIGVRIEHLQKDIDIAQYGNKTKLKLPAADYKLVYHGDRSCYSFCMCPGGEVISSSSDIESIVTNGMSEFKRDKINANAALLVNILPSDLKGNDPLEGFYFQRDLEHKAFVLAGNNYYAPCQKVIDFENNVPSINFGKISPSYKPNVTLCNLNDILPNYVSKTIKEALPYFDTKLKGFNNPEAILTGVETRSSCPVTIVRNDALQTSNHFLYPAGEGSGYAGGITTSAIDGIKVARSIMKQK